MCNDAAMTFPMYTAAHTLGRDRVFDTGRQLHEAVVAVPDYQGCTVDGIIAIDADGYPARYDHRSGHWGPGGSPEGDQVEGPWTIVHVPTDATIASIIHDRRLDRTVSAVWAPSGPMGPHAVPGIIQAVLGEVDDEHPDRYRIHGFGHGEGWATAFGTLDDAVSLKPGQRVVRHSGGEIEVRDA